MRSEQSANEAVVPKNIDTLVIAQAAPQDTTDSQTKVDDAPVTGAVADTIDTAYKWTEQATEALRQHVLTEAVAVQLAVLVATGLLAWLLSRPGRKILDRLWPPHGDSRLKTLRQTFSSVLTPLFWVLLLWLSTSVLRQNGYENTLVRAVASLANAWVLIRLFSTLIQDTFWSKTFAALAWFVAALNILKLLDPTVVLLDSVAVRVGETRISAYLIIKGLIFAAILIWAASALSRVLNARINSASALTPSVQTLISQTVRLGLLIAAVVITLGTIGIDLTALAVFSGAIGVGIGFGLQSVFSNLVAGIILLFERSIKVGDFVELTDGIQGTVREITIRSTLVTTNDNIDVLVPNSEFITKQMTNWTLRDAFRRFRIPFGVAYGSDKDLVKKAVLEAADGIEHTLHDVEGRHPQVWLVGFGDSSLDFELVVWLKPESVTRPAAVNAAYCWAIESALKKYGIEIPFPQRDLHIRSGLPKLDLPQS